MTPATRGRLGLPVFLAAALAASGLAASQADDEPPPSLTAAALLSAAERAGPHHVVGDAVLTPGEYHEFQITSDFGVFTAVGRTQFTLRLQEIAALAVLQDVNKTGVFVKAAGTSLARVGTGVVNAVSDPVDTAKGIGGGVKRWGVNLGRRTKRAVQKVTAGDGAESGASAGERAGDAAGSVAKSVFGVNRARREWARRVGADPYTTNPVLKAALEEVATVDAAGGLATKVLVPIPSLVGMTSDVGDLVWGRDPEELRKLNETRARDLGVGSDTARTFFRNDALTLTAQTRLLSALHAVNVPGAGDYVASAAEAGDEREAMFFVESAEMLPVLHARSPVESVLMDSRALVARLATGEAVALLPFDWLRWTTAAGDEFREIATRARAELRVTSLRLEVSGQVTERATRELAGLGWRR